MKTNPALIIVPALLLLLVSSVSSTASPSERDLGKLSPDDLTERLRELDASVYYGGVMVSGGESLTGRVVVIDGALDIQDGGVLDGDVWIVGGRLIMTGHARIRGGVVLVNSDMFTSRAAEIGGEVVRYACECRFKAEDWEESRTLGFEKEEDPMAIRIKPAIRAGTPKRVQYTVLRLGLQRQNPRRPDPYVSGHALVDVPPWSSTHGHFGFDAGVEVPLRGHSAGLVLRGYKKVFSNDYWQVSSVENAGILLLTGYEFADYHESRGAEAGLEFSFAGYMNLSLIAAWRKDYSLETGKAPSLFKSNVRLPENPAIDDGERVTLSVSFVYDSREEPESPGDAWYVAVWGEKGFADGPGEFSYEAFQLDLRKYSTLPWDLRLDLGGKLFSTFSAAPRQVYQSLGGYGGVRGLHDRPFDVRRGDRLVLLSGELRRPLPPVRYIRSILTSWDLLLFYDTGLLVETDNPTDPLGFLDTPYGEWGRSVGLGVTGESFVPYLGLYVARDLDNGYESLRVILRIKKSF
jgi:hypothetical protein